MNHDEAIYVGSSMMSAGNGFYFYLREPTRTISIRIVSSAQTDRLLHP